MEKETSVTVLCERGKMGFEGGNGNVVTEGLGMGIYMGWHACKN